MLTGQAWQQLMHDIMDIYYIENGEVTYSYAIFFVTWLIFSKYMLCNQFAAIVCDTMSETRQAERHPVSKLHAEAFNRKWSEWQQIYQGHGEAHSFMPYTQVPEFLGTLRETAPSM